MPRLQWPIWRMMAWVVAAALLFSWARTQESWQIAVLRAASTPSVWVCAFLACIALGRRWLQDCFAPGAARGTFAVLVTGLLTTAYVSWAHYRVEYVVLTGLDGSWPYPDPAIRSLLRWLDARNPAPPGMIKIHCEIPVATAILGALTSALSALSGLLLGALPPRESSAGQSVRHNSPDPQFLPIRS